MWKIFLSFALLFSVCSLSACDVAEMSTLREVSRPYLGVYECRTLTLGETDLLTDFDFIRLELSPENSFTLSYRLHGGKEESVEGEYSADPERGEVVLAAKRGGKRYSRCFAMEGGAIVIDGNVLGKFLFAEFRLP